MIEIDIPKMVGEAIEGLDIALAVGLPFTVSIVLLILILKFGHHAVIDTAIFPVLRRLLIVLIAIIVVIFALWMATG